MTTISKVSKQHLEPLSSSSSFYKDNSVAKNRYRNDFHDSGGIENQSVQELENYAVYKSEETTQVLYGCLRIAEEMRETASTTLVTLHQQGEQIHRTHEKAAGIEPHLSRGEKLLGSLGGIFSKKWKPKKTRRITGPRQITDAGDSFARKGIHKEQRQKLGLSTSLPHSEPRQITSEPKSTLHRVEMEKVKQDDAVTDLSNVLGEFKNMAIAMGSEIERQHTAINDVEDDTDEYIRRLKGANRRANHLLSK